MKPIMIPDIISPERKNSAEGKLFREFQSFQADEPIIILHSLGISEHVDNVFGEIDFVIISYQGILCAEVKGGDVSRSKGLWKYTDRDGLRPNDPKRPFMQAQGNMQSLRKYLKKRLGKEDPLAACQYACCVLMPDCRFKNDEIEMIPEVLFDKSRP